MMSDTVLLEAVEKYIRGEMTPDERLYFENLRKSNPEVDQMVVEHTLFLQQLNRFGEWKKFKSLLQDTHTDLSEKGVIESSKLKGKAKVVYLFNKYKRVASIAAAIAGITTLTISSFIWLLSPVAPTREIAQLKGKYNELENKYRIQDREIKNVKTKINSNVVYKSGGTSFIIDVKGYLVTNAHVIANAKHIVVQNNNGLEYAAKIIFVDKDRDIAILKIEDDNYKPLPSIPYTIKKTSSDLSEPIYTLGFPKNEIVYGEGYLSAKSGYNGDTLTCQIAVAANPGNSGGPVLNLHGEIIGILSTKQTTADGVVFATLGKYIYQAMDDIKNDSTILDNIKLPYRTTLKGLDKVQQVKKIEDYIYMVKVD